MSKPAVRISPRRTRRCARSSAGSGPAVSRSGNQQPFETLVRAVAHQQIHGRAAEAILGRFIALFPGPGIPQAGRGRGMPASKMRARGSRGGRSAAIKHIAARPRRPRAHPAGCHALTDEILIERLTRAARSRPVDVEMLLIFTLGRPDVRGGRISGSARASRSPMAAQAADAEAAPALG